MKTKAIFYSIITICLISFNLNTALAGDIVWEIFKNKTSYDFNKLKTTDSIPDQVIKLDSLKTIDNSTLIDHFSSRIRGYLTPTVSGNYSFYFACDNVGQFWLSPDANDTNAKLKSEIFSAETDWSKNVSSQQLIAGQKYFFEIMHYDSVYTDLVMLGWKIPGASNPIAIKSTYITSNGDNVPINKLLFPDNTITAFPNWTITPRYQILPWNASNKEIQWLSSNTAVATVDDKGIIHTLSPGECQIIGKSAENASITSTLQLTVTNYYGPYFVKPNGNGKGKTWDDAISLTVFLDMLNQGTLQKQVKVYAAEGIYKPTNTIDRNKTFSLSNIRLVGGFSQTSTGVDTTQRNIVANETILSGEIGKPDDNIDNCYHVVTATKSNILDGITISDGKASSYSYGSIAGKNNIANDNRGGGISIPGIKSDIMINNCKIINNSAWDAGGGIYCHSVSNTLDNSSSVTILNSEFYGNVMDQKVISTGGMFVLVVNCHGGAIAARISRLNISGCKFFNNTAKSYGKAIYIHLGAEAIIENCSFYDNHGNMEDVWVKDGGIIKMNNSTLDGSIVALNANLELSNSTITGGGYFYPINPNHFVKLDNVIWPGGRTVARPNEDIGDINVAYSIFKNHLYGNNYQTVVLDSVVPCANWLDALAYNGGLTPTMKLKDIPDNPAKENGNPLYLGTMDQRGVVRSDKVSIGAYQWVKTTGIETTELTKLVKVYPNPVADELSIELKGNTKISDFKIVNLQGQVVSQGSLIVKTKIPTSNLAPGFYLLQFENGKNLESIKFIKE